MIPCYFYAAKKHKTTGKGGETPLNNLQNQLATKEAVKSKFRGNNTVKCRRTPKYPSSAEREFFRVVDAFMKMLNETLKEHLPAVMASYKKQRRGDSRFDDANGLDKDIRREFMEISKELEQKIQNFGVQEFIERVGKVTQRSSLREWKRVIHDTLGVDLLDDYYNGDFYSEQLRKWVDENVLKIKSIPGTMLNEMRETILEGYLQGEPIRDIQKEIQQRYNVNKHQARSLARDQIGTLNSQITRLQQKDAGCNRYRWSTSKDSRVRDCHRELDNKIISWDEPPEMWYETKSRGRVYTGRHCHPGEDYCCRCVAIPVFDIETLNIPFKR